MLKIWKRLDKKRVAIILLLIFAEATLFLILPTLASDILNVSSLEGDRSRVNTIGFWMIAANTLTIFLAIVSTRLAAKESQGLGNMLRKEMYNKIMNFSKKEISQFGTSTLMTRTTNDIMQIQLVTMFAMRLIMIAPVIMIVSAFLAYQLEPQLSWVFGITLPTIAIAIGIIFYVANPYFKTIQLKTDKLNQVFREGLTGIRVIRAFNTTDYENKRFAGVNKDYRDTAIRAFTLLNLILPLMFGIMGVSNVLIFTGGSQLIQAGEMATGSLIAFVQYSIQVLMSIINISMLLFFIPRAQVAANRVLEVLETESTIKDTENPISLDNRPLSLVFDNVAFGFEGAERDTVANINFTAKPGDTIAIIGGTGSGKSTLANLITRLYDATSGEVKFNDINVKDVTQKDLRDRIGYAPQKAVLFSGTIRSNMKYGKPDATDEEIWHALDIAQGDFVRELPRGLDSRVEQGGNNFSGGQKQRLSIARAIVSRPDVYVFDDSFSALDFKTDAKLRAALKPETREAITVIIAQRVNTVVDADQIIVLDNGQIVGHGTHEELKNNNEIYKDIIDSQMRGEDI